MLEYAGGGEDVTCSRWKSCSSAFGGTVAGCVPWAGGFVDEGAGYCWVPMGADPWYTVGGPYG